MSILRSKKDVGELGEKRAARYLRRHGYRVVARNLHCGHNELDLVVKNKHYIVFVEVKARSFDTADEALLHRPALAVDAAKRARTVQAAKDFLRRNHCTLCPRFDVVEVYLDRSHRYKTLKLHHIEGAFDAKGHIC